MSRRPGERWGQFAERVANAFGVVLLLVLATYALGSLTPFKGWTAALTTLVASMAGVVGLAGAGARPAVVRAAAIFALAAVILAILSEVLDDLHLLGASSFIVFSLLLLAAGAILHAVLAETEVGFRTILGAISVYTILGLLFTFLYAALDRVQSAPFFGSGVTRRERRLPLLQLHHAHHHRLRQPGAGRPARQDVRRPGDADGTDLPGHPGRRAGQPLASEGAFALPAAAPTNARRARARP